MQGRRLMADKIIVALLSAILGGGFTYAIKAAALEGRMDGIEKTVERIENKLDKLK